MHALYDACEAMYAEQEDDGVTMFVVISAIDYCAYGPFDTRAAALAFAETSDGTVFTCVAEDADGSLFTCIAGSVQ
jgi:hypothetical protein